MASAVYQPTASQFASATVHMERRDEWRTVRIDGVRYVSMVSGRSNRVYLVRADAGGCSCSHYRTTWRTCAHMLAVELAATLDELIEQAAAIEDALAEAASTLLSRKTIEQIWATCWTDGCDEDPIAHSGGCHKHANSEAY